MNVDLPVVDIKRILYATDLSENARYAYKYAASIAQQYNARITILHVIEHLTTETFLQIHGFVGEEKWNQLQEEKREDFVTRIQGMTQAGIAFRNQCAGRQFAEVHRIEMKRKIDCLAAITEAE